MDEWVREADGRVAVLFGAGASKPNLPTSAQLLERVADYLDETLNGDLSVHQLWRAIRPQIERIRTETGNIEDAYEAVRTLTYQDTDPTRFFIDAFTQFDFYPDTDEGRRTRSQDASFICTMLEDRSIDVLGISSKDAPLDHFEPLLRASKVGILTLNYDDLVERAAGKFGVPLSTGAEDWDGGFRWVFPPDVGHLVKVHGSYLWRTSRVLNEGVGGLANVGLHEVGGANEPSPNRRMDSTVVFGAGLKLTPHGPFPALWRSFTDHLELADVLVVVGYRFADEHINAAIYRWATLVETRRIVIVDPYPLLDPVMFSSTYASMLSALWDEYRDPVSGVPGFAGSGGGPNRIKIIKQGVVEVLPEVFG